MALSVGDLLVNIRSDTTQLISGFNRAEAAVNKTTKQMTYAVKGLIGAFVGLNTLDIAKNFTTQLDLITSANNKLKLVTKTTEEYTIAQKRLFEVAQITSAGYSETVTLYSKLSDSMGKMGKSQADIIRTVETVNKTIALSGSTASEASSAILQLGQAFGSGRLQGDELKSISENAQGLALAIAEGMGVAVGELKQLGADGKITSEILATALEKVANSTDEKYGKMTKTIAQSMQIVKNSIGQTIAQFDKMTGVSNVIADNIQGISKALDSLNTDDLESMFNTFKVGAELIVASYVAIKLLRGGIQAYNVVSNITTEIEKKRTTATLLQSESLKAKELAELASLKTANSYNLATKQAEFQTQAQIKSTQALQTELLKQSVAIEKNVAKQTVMNDKLRSSVINFNMASLSATAFKMVLSTIPFIAITTGIGLIVEKLLSASKESTLFKESLTKTTDELKKLSQAQIEVRIIGGVEELKKAEEQLAKLKKDLEKVPSNISIGGNVGGIGTIDVEKTNKKLSEQRSIIQANIDTVQFQVDKNKELLGILNDIKGEKTTSVNIKTILPKEETNVIDWLINGDETINKKVNVTVETKDLTDDLKKILEPDTVIYEEYAKLFEDLAKTDKNTAENRAELAKQMNEKIANLDKEGVQKQKEALKKKEKDFEDSENKRKNLIKEATELITSEVDKINAKYLEMYNALPNEEQKIALTKKWNEDLDKVNGTLDAQKEKQDLANQAMETSTTEYDKIIDKYLKMYDAIKDNPLWDIEKQNEFFKKLTDDLDNLEKKLDFSATIELDTIGEDKSIQRIEKSFQDLSKATKKYEENRKDIAKGSADEAKNEEMFRKDQMNGYINMAGALGSMFEQGSKEAATFQAAQLSLALVEGTRAILTSGTGDPYTAIPRMAAMAIMVKSLLGNIGVALGMNSTSTSGDSFSMATSNTGVGSTLGDSKKASESISNALKTLEDFAEPQYEVLNSMNSYLKTIANNISGVSSLLVQNSATALGTNYTGGFDTGYKNNLKTANGAFVFNPINDLISKIPVIGQVNGLFGSITNTVIGGLFGKTSVSRELKDSGIYFADALLKNAKDDFEGSAYQTIATTVKTKSWFGSSSKTSLKTVFSGLNDEIENQFSLVLGGIYDTVLLSGQALDISTQSLYNSLDNFVVSIGKVSLKDKTGTEIQEILTNIFSKVGDDLTKSVIPNLTGFQQVGEGLFDTLTRVATGIQEASFYIDRLGTSTVKYTDIINQQGVVGFEALAQSLIKADEATYGLNNGVVQMIDNMDATAEELYTAYLAFGNIRDVLTATSQSASNLSSSMILGAGSISLLESGTKSYMENFLSDSERLNIQLENLSDEFKIAGYEMPKTRQGFINLIKSIDTSTDEGAKAYGRLIGLSDSYNETISEIEDNLSSLIDTFSNLGDSVAQTIATLAGADTDSQSATNQIKSFWEKRKEIDSLLALNGNLTEAQQSRLSTLVGEVNSLATNIQGLDTSSSSITNELIGNLTSLESALNFKEQVLSVNIVGVAPNVALIENITGISATVPTLTNNTSNYVTSDNLSTDIKDILTTIKNNLSTYPQRTYDILDDVINGNQRVKVQTN